MKTFGIFTLLAMLVGFSYNPPALPDDKETFTIPQNMSAGSVLLYDLKKGEDLAALKTEYTFPIASLSKIMTGLLGLEYIDPDEAIKISAEAVGTEGAAGDLEAGEEILFRDLLSMMMMHSSNDAAAAVAEEVGKRLGGATFEESTDLFVSAMNEKARRLGMHGTLFQNPTGLDIEDTWPSNYSNAHDLALLIKETTAFPILWEASRDIEKTILSKAVKQHHIANLNILAPRIPLFIGGKTGSTDNVGGTLVLLFEYPMSNPMTLIILDSPSRDSRFQDAELFLKANGIL